MTPGARPEPPPPRGNSRAHVCLIVCPRAPPFLRQVRQCARDCESIYTLRLGLEVACPARAALARAPVPVNDAAAASGATTRARASAAGARSLPLAPLSFSSSSCLRESTHVRGKNPSFLRI